MGIQVQTVFHELGHLYNMVTGLGSSAWVYDVDPLNGTADAQKQDFNARLDDKCSLK